MMKQTWKVGLTVMLLAVTVDSLGWNLLVDKPEEKPGQPQRWAEEKAILAHAEVFVKAFDQADAGGQASADVDAYTVVHVQQNGKWLTAMADIVQRPAQAQIDWKKELAFLEGTWIAKAKGYLSEEETQMLMHFGKESTQQWSLVRLEAPEDGQAK